MITRTFGAFFMIILTIGSASSDEAALDIQDALYDLASAHDELKELGVKSFLFMSDFFVRLFRHSTYVSPMLIESLAQNTMATAHPGFAAAGTLTKFLSTFGFPMDSDEMKLLKEIDKKLDAVLHKLVELSQQFDYTAVTALYKLDHRDLYSISEKSQTAISTGAKNHLGLFKSECERIPPENLLNNIYTAVVEEFIQPHLLPSMLNMVKKDRTKLMSWFRIIATDSLIAAQLSLVRMGARGMEDATLHHYEGQGGKGTRRTKGVCFV